MCETVMEGLFKKNNYATDKLRAHSYIPLYERLFQKRRHRIFNLLEIGIGSGGSLQLWNDYFENANIYGIDLNYRCDYLDRYPRIHQIKEDAYTTRCVQNNFVSQGIEFEIVIDDGPHNKKSQMIAMKMYFELLTKDGIIVIEDVQDYLEPGVWIKDVIGSLPEQYRQFARIMDFRYLNKSPDDLLIVLDKSDVHDFRKRDQ